MALSILSEYLQRYSLPGCGPVACELCFPLILHVTRLPLIWLSFCCFDALTFFFLPPHKVEDIKAYHIKKHSCTENKTTTKNKEMLLRQVFEGKEVN